ncbi:MAG: dienelactone hydrolase family protein [Chloroflexi bacterium]|nr:dienelactone hydrolase family protein [Chloroflexota bacterium]
MSYEGMMAETIHIHGHQGDIIEAYLARPLGPGPYPTVVVIHQMPGWVDAVKEITRKFAHHGYAAISPNLHYREKVANRVISPEDAAAAVRAAGGVPDDRCVGDIQGAVDYLHDLPYGNGKVGVIGYCSGGRQTFLVACTIKEFNAAVVCYGGGIVMALDRISPQTPVAPIDMTKDLGCPLLYLHGLEDTSPSPQEAATVEAELKRLEKTSEFHAYPNTGHGFFNPDGAGYRQPAAVDGWQRIWAWYGKYLAPSQA